ncbi:disease resistance-like protein DSC1 [Ziziphus jujuba]|uniref:Disease resistance-like protein DSC1 n=1 Tax=Ziziphus jujuba TaxID=326968 RepID=A0ABM4AB72_ZIZJJ|nr:disease resistance-like protein DSC1 [Ziziphus jujuba]
MASSSSLSFQDKYDVFLSFRDPSVVRKQTGSYAVSFAELEERFRDRMEKVHQWRAALTEVSNLSGLDSKEFRPEKKLVQIIFEDITKKLPKYLSSNMHTNGHLTRIEKEIKEIVSILCIGTEDARIIGIWGMAGSPAKDYEKLVNHVICYAHGNPLALKVLGSSLCSKRTDVWESALTFVITELTALIDKSLIESHIDNKLRMHDLLRQLGQTIVRDEHIEPSKRSRLWDVKDVCHVLEKNMGTAAVKSISFNVFEISKDVKLCHAAFSEMHNLRILKICCDNIGNDKFKLYLPQGLGSYLSDKLAYLRWDLYPLKSLPSNFSPENLVELVLRGSHVQKLWNNHEVKSLPVLRRIDLSCSKFLTQLPDLSQSSNLESINLEGCKSLVQVLSSLQNLEKLTYLNLRGCSKLRDFEEISKRTEGFLDVARLGGIKNPLKIFTYLKRCIQSFIGNLNLYSSPDHISQKFAPNLRYLILRETAIETVTPSIAYLSVLVQLDLRDCKRLKSLPTSICHLKSLELLVLLGCAKLETFPEILKPMEHLREPALDFSGIQELPESIENLVSLKNLSLGNSEDLEFLPNSLCNLRNLELIWLCSCSKIQKLPALPPSLPELVVNDCEKLKSIAEIPSLCLRLSATGCTSLENI